MSEAPASDDLLTLEDACANLLHGLCRPATLRAAIERGELMAEKIGRRILVTPRYIAEWRNRCRLARDQRDSGSDRPTKTERRSGASSTADAASAQAAARARVQKLRLASPTTSPASVTPQRSAAVLPLKP